MESLLFVSSGSTFSTEPCERIGLLNIYEHRILCLKVECIPLTWCIARNSSSFRGRIWKFSTKTSKNCMWLMLQNVSTMRRPAGRSPWYLDTVPHVWIHLIELAVDENLLPLFSGFFYLPAVGFLLWTVPQMTHLDIQTIEKFIAAYQVRSQNLWLIQHIYIWLRLIYPSSEPRVWGWNPVEILPLKLRRFSAVPLKLLFVSSFEISLAVTVCQTFRNKSLEWVFRNLLASVLERALQIDSWILLVYLYIYISIMYVHLYTLGFHVTEMFSKGDVHTQKAFS